VDRRSFLSGSLALFAAPLVVEAQPAVRAPRIGYLGGGPPSPFHDAFRSAFQQLGYRDGENVAIEYRWTEGSLQRAKEYAAELLQNKVDVIVAVGPASVVAVRDVVRSIPIVFALSPDPVRLGVVESLARPGRNMTGLAFDPTPALTAKVVELLREAVPKMSRLAIMWNPNSPGNELYFDAARKAGEALNLNVQRLAVQERDEIDPALSSMQRERAQGLVIAAEQLLTVERVRIINFANRNRISSASYLVEFATAGSLLAYGPSATSSSAGPRILWTGFSRAPSPPTSPSNNPRSSS